MFLVGGEVYGNHHGSHARFVQLYTSEGFFLLVSFRLILVA